MIVVVYLYFSCSFYYLRSSALSIRYINEVQTTAKDQLHGATSPIVVLLPVISRIYYHQGNKLPIWKISSHNHCYFFFWAVILYDNNNQLTMARLT